MSSNNPPSFHSVEEFHQLIQAYNVQHERLSKLQQEVDQAKIEAQKDTQAAQNAVNTNNSQQITTVAPSLSFKPIKPNTFHGNNKVSVEAWVFEMEQYFAIVRMREDEKVKFAGAFLREMASSWWKSVNEADQPTPQEWNEFKAALIKRFQPVAATKTARAILNSLKQTKSVQEYCNIFLRQLQLISDMSPSDQIDRFLNGLKPHIASEIDMHDPKVLEETMNLAQRAEIRRNNYQRSF